jgi:S1-C subfamily serine protease
MMNLIAQLPPDKAARLTFLRKGKPITLQVMIGTRAQPKNMPSDDEEDGPQ